MEKIPVARLIYIDDMMYNCKDGSRNFRKGGGGGRSILFGDGDCLVASFAYSMGLLCV